MNCLVTAGPSWEPLDEVRRLTNFSTGRLGGELAAFLTERGHTVTLLLGEAATWRGERRAARIETFSTTADLRRRLEALASLRVEAVFHAAAVSDFRPGKVWRRTAAGRLEEVAARKIASRGDALLVELAPTEKLILNLRDWFPRAWLVGWKYELDGTRADALARALRQIQESRTAACVVNGAAYGPGFGLVTPEGRCAHFETPEALFAGLEAEIRRRAAGGAQGA